jgi:hypothetical protein
MILSEYKEIVSPILKEFRKFIRKNSKYFAIQPYYGIVFQTAIDYIQSQIEYGQKRIEQEGEKDWVLSLYSIESMAEKAKETWTKNGGVLEEIPTEVSEQYKRLKDMKTKVQTEGYSRSTEYYLTSLMKKLTEKVEVVLEPYTDKLRQRKEDEILEKVQSYFSKGSGTSLYDYAKSVTKNYRDQDELYRVLSVYIDGKTKQKRRNFDSILENEKENYVQNFISKFVSRFDEKLSVASEKLGSPDIEFHSVDFKGSNLLVRASVKFEDVELYCETDVILAGGAYTMQVLHQRYLMKFFKDGKKISLENIDNLK